MTSHQPPTRPPRLQPRSPRTASAFLGLLFLVLLSACTGTAGASDDVATLVDPSASPDASPSASLDPEQAMQAFAACMREHGVDIQVSSAGEGAAGGGKVISGNSGSGPKTGTGTDQGRDDLEAANKACGHLLPRGGMNAPGGTMDPEMEQKLLDFSRCMREHGIDMPDPKFENGGATVQLGGPDDDGSNLDPTSQEFKDAEKACESILPKPQGGDSGPVTQGTKP